jgi:hypothetical protein
MSRGELVALIAVALVIRRRRFHRTVFAFAGA